jgi:hypothetical protein
MKNMAVRVEFQTRRSSAPTPGFIPSYLVLCQANLMLGLLEGAIVHATKVKRLSPPDPYPYVFHTREGLATDRRCRSRCGSALTERPFHAAAALPFGCTSAV